MAHTNDAHWSKDFVEHLRIVHFALILLSAALIITGTDRDSPQMVKALTQAQEIAKFEQQWPTIPKRLYEQAMVNAKLHTEWLVALERPKDSHSTFISSVDVPRSVIVGNEAWRFGETRFPAELASISDFKEIWNTLNHGVALMIPKEPTTHSPCTFSFVYKYDYGSPDFEGSREIVLPGEIAKCDIPEGFTKALAVTFRPSNTQIALHPYEEVPPLPGKQIFPTPIAPVADAHRPKLTLEMSWILPPGTVTDEMPKNVKQIESVVIVGLDASTLPLREDSLKELFSRDWGRGDFDAAFPELSSRSTGFSTVRIGDAVLQLQSQVTSLDKNISLLGFPIPIAQLARWGAVFLLATQLYLWLHLHELSARLEPDDEGWSVAWIGLYRSRAARAISLLTCFFLPVAASMVLATRIVSIALYYHRTAIAMSSCIVLLSALLGGLTFWRLIKLQEQPSSKNIFVDLS